MNATPVLPFEITRIDLPALYLTASKTSTNSQTWYIRLIFFNLAFLAVSALLASFYSNNPQITHTLILFTTLLILASIIVSILIELLKLDRNWYGGRAIAESVKTISWKYMTCTSPYEASRRNVDAKFIKDLAAILKEKKFLSGNLGGQLSNSPQISDKMRQLRAMSIRTRLEAYTEYRIKNQREWYGENADKNNKQNNKYFLLMLFSEIIGLLCVVFITLNIDTFNPIGFFSTIAASFLAWIQVKQYKELAQSYGVATQELGMSLEESKLVHSDRALSKFVNNTENAISREHTLWIARKGQL